MGVAFSVAKILLRQEHHRRNLAVLSESILVSVHQAALSHGRRRLQSWNRLRPTCTPERSYPGRDGARCHKDNLRAHLLDTRQIGDEPVQGVVVQLEFSRDCTAANFYDDALHTR